MSSKSAAAKLKKPKAPKTHPPVSEMVVNAISTLKERRGSSLQAIKKYLAAQYNVDAKKLAVFIRKFLKSAVAKGQLLQTTGRGASGSFKLPAAGKKAGEAKKPKAAKPKAAPFPMRSPDPDSECTSPSLQRDATVDGISLLEVPQSSIDFHTGPGIVPLEAVQPIDPDEEPEVVQEAPEDLPSLEALWDIQSPQATTKVVQSPQVLQQLPLPQEAEMDPLPVPTPKTSLLPPVTPYISFAPVLVSTPQRGTRMDLRVTVEDIEFSRLRESSRIREDSCTPIEDILEAMNVPTAGPSVPAPAPPVAPKFRRIEGKTEPMVQLIGNDGKTKNVSEYSLEAVALYLQIRFFMAERRCWKMKFDEMKPHISLLPPTSDQALKIRLRLLADYHFIKLTESDDEILEVEIKKPKQRN